jgi:hypothetical protein
METDAGETPRAQAHHVADSLVEVDLAAELKALRASDSYQAVDLCVIGLPPSTRFHHKRCLR